MLFREITANTNGTYRPPYVHGDTDGRPECYPIGEPTHPCGCIRPIGFADNTCPVPVPVPVPIGNGCVSEKVMNP